MPIITDLSESFRKIKSSLVDSKKSLEEREQELDFFNTIFTSFLENINSGYYFIIPVHFNICPIDKAKQYAQSLGLYVVEGSSGCSYLSYGKENDF